MTNVDIGIDPGDSSGCPAVIAPSGIYTYKLSEMSDHNLYFTLAERAGDVGLDKVRAVLEKVHAMPRQGVSSSFKFGVSYGRCRMALAAAGIPFEEVSPQKWQGYLGCKMVTPEPIVRIRAYIKRLKADIKETDPKFMTKDQKALIKNEEKKLKTLQSQAAAQHKRDLKAKAQQLFPSVKVTLGNADALLLAEYCRRTRG